MNNDVESMAREALTDEKVLAELLEGILSKKDEIRFGSFQVLLHLSEEHPEVLYPRWDYFAGLLDSDNSYRQYIAVYLIASLTKADSESRFEKIFDRYYGILGGKGTVAAAHLVLNSGKVARAKPHLRAEITNRLLNIDKIHHGKQKELIKGHAVDALSEYFEEAGNKGEIIGFVRQQLESGSPRTRKAAGEFLKRWGDWSGVETKAAEVCG